MENQTELQDYEYQILWARKVLTDPTNYLILDTETTGLEWGREIIQVSAIDATGAVLLNTLVKPTQPIPAAASKIHGITDKTVKDAPTWPEVYPAVVVLLNSYQAMTYNSAFDVQMIHSSCWRNSIQEETFNEVDCAMMRYSTYYGDWSEYHGSYRWQRLPGGDHSALGDCKATLDLIRKMAASKLDSEKQS